MVGYFESKAEGEKLLSQWDKRTPAKCVITKVSESTLEQANADKRAKTFEPLNNHFDNGIKIYW